MRLGPTVTEIEVRRNRSCLLDGAALIDARRQLAVDLDAFALVALDATTCGEAARIAEETLCRSFDSLHLAAALRAGPTTTVLTFDHRQAQVARSPGLAVRGAQEGTTRPPIGFPQFVDDNHHVLEDDSSSSPGRSSSRSSS